MLFMTTPENDNPVTPDQLEARFAEIDPFGAEQTYLVSLTKPEGFGPKYPEISPSNILQLRESGTTEQRIQFGQDTNKVLGGLSLNVPLLDSTQGFQEDTTIQSELNCGRQNGESQD